MASHGGVQPATDLDSAHPDREDSIAVQCEHADYLASVDTAVQAAVTAAVSVGLGAVDPGLAPFADIAQTASTTGGKRLRPRFAYWAWRLVATDSAATGQIVTVGAALELLHAAILVHDDVIDRSELRRGLPSVRAGLAAHHRARGWTGSAEDFGDHTALLIGDLLWAAAHDLIDSAASDLDRQRRRPMIEAFRAMRAEVISGQLLELCAQSGADFSAATAEKILQYKTSAYTVERPVELGLRIAGVDPSAAAALGRFAHATGHAFQLRDDLSDLFAPPLRSGKRIGDDIRSGKPTEMLGTALRLVSPADRTTVLDVIGRADATDEQIAGVRVIFVDCGSVAAIVERIDRLVADARRSLQELGSRDRAEVVTALQGLLAECVDLSFLSDALTVHRPRSHDEREHDDDADEADTDPHR